MPRTLTSMSTHSAVTLILLSFSCGSTDKAPAQTQSPTSIDETKVLSSLSTADMQTLCSDFKGYLVRQVAQEYSQRFCTQGAFAAASMGTAADPSQACHDSYTNCITSASGTSSGISISGLCPSSPGVTSCSLTVATYLQCLNEIIDAAKAAWNLKDNLCDDLGSCTGLCASPLTLPTTCVLVRDTCAGMVPSVDYTTVT